MKDKLLEYKTYLINIKRSLVYYNYLKTLADYLEEKQLIFESLTKDQLSQYFTDKKYSENAICNVIKSCRDYCKYIKLEQHVCFEIKLLEVAKKLRVYAELEDIQKAIKYMATYNVRLNIQKIEVVLYLLFYTGIRKSELYHLKREDINLESCTLKIFADKTNEEKIIPFPAKLRDKIMAYFNSEKEENNAFNLNNGNLEYIFREVISKHIGKKLSPHKMRHGAGKFLLEKGVPLTVVQKMFGHKNIQTTLIYLEADQKYIEKNYRDKIG